MNMSKAISDLKMRHGLYNITLPFKDDITGETMPTEQVIHEVLSVMTIPQYSQFEPWLRTGVISIKDLKCINEREGIYLLPKYLTMTPVIYISHVRLPFSNIRGTYGDIAPSFGINRSIQGVITAQEYMMLAGQMRAEPTFKDLGDNKIGLYGWPKTRIEIEVACEHEPNGESIPDSCYDSFMELANLDLGIFLYNNLIHYDNLPSAHGTTSLKIDRYSGYEDKRDQLLERWRDTFHLDMDFEAWM